MGAGPTLDELVVADDPATWRELGFAVEGDVCRIGAVRVRMAGRAAGRGIVSWALRGIAAVELDGLPTTRSGRPPCAGAAHPNATESVDHVVVLSPDFDRTVGAFESAGLELRRVREAGAGEHSFRQGFFRLGEVILELVERLDAPPGPAAFWGLVFVTADLDGAAARLGERVKAPHDAVQPGRRIATVRREAGLSAAAAFMSPDPRGRTPGAPAGG